ncbi:MAG TPA: zinc-ribbon and DUF3426 domain-containing protein [Rudaea sp.]
MYTQCPECLTIYKVGAETLAPARGHARCGHCAAVFDMLPALTDTLPPEPFLQLPLLPAAELPPQLNVPALRPKAQQDALLFDPDDRRRRTPRPSTPPAFARDLGSGVRTRSWPWALGTLALLLTLGAQVAYAERAALLDDARVRPMLDGVCAAIGCQLPLRHAPSRFVLLSRDIRPHPSVPNALIISASLRNDANFAQAFPNVEITLSDLDENRIAMRRFAPRDYVGDARAIAAGLAPGSTTALVFEVLDPGKNAVAFEFKFL